MESGGTISRAWHVEGQWPRHGECMEAKLAGHDKWRHKCQGHRKWKHRSQGMASGSTVSYRLGMEEENLVGRDDNEEA